MMAIARYMIFIVALFTATYSAATFDARMKGDKQPPPGVAGMPAISITEVEVIKFVHQVRSSIDDMRIDEVWRTMVDSARSLADLARGGAGRETP